MKKLMCLFAMLQITIAMLGQATDLVITTPKAGKLSQQISEADQVTVRNLKVIGNINATDLIFIGSLINKKLRGTVDLSDAVIKQMDGHNPFYMQLPEDQSYPPIVQELLLPKSLEIITGDYWFSSYLQFNTLVFDTKVKTLNGHSFDRCAKHLVLGENIDSIKGPIINSTIHPWSCETIKLMSYPRYLDRFILDQTNSFVLSEDNVAHLVNVEHIGHTAFGGSTDGHGEICNKRVLSEIDTLNFPNIRSFHFNSFTYHSGLHLYLGSNLKEVFFDNNPYYYSADGVTFHIAAKNPPKHDYDYSWMKGNYTIMVPKESVNDYIESGWPHVYPEPVPLTAIDITPKNIIFEVGETMQLIATPVPETADEVDFVWENNNEDVVKLSKTGEITALMSGEAQITVSSIDGQIKSTITVIVATHVTDIKLSHESCQLSNIGDSFQLEANIFPPNATNKEVNWKSTNETVCVVVHGKIVATGFGTAVVLASTVDGDYTAECIVTVTQPVEALTLEKHELNLRIGETGRLYAQIVPATANDKTIVWTSSDDEVATVDANGVVTAMKGGEAWIKAAAKDNAEAKDSCKVTIFQPVTGLVLDKASVKLTIGDTETLNATVVPENASNKEIRWSSSNEDACVVSNGTLVGVGRGSSIIIATSVDGGFVATCTVKVTAQDMVNGDLWGDVNNDGVVDVADIATVIRIMAERAKKQEEATE